MNLSELADYFSSLSRKLSSVDYSVPLDSCLEVVRDDINSHFAQQVSGDGSPWPATKSGKAALAGTVVQRLATGGAAGHVEEVTKKALTFGSSDPISLVHELGNSTTPARPHMGVGGQAVEKCTDIVADHLVKIITS